MAEFKEITYSTELEEILEESCRRKVVVFKHSTTCPTSARAWREVQNFYRESSKDVLVAMIKVIETRSVSNQVADFSGVKHQSPQVLLLSNKQVLWHDSHQEVTQSNIMKAIEGETMPFNIIV